VNRWIKATPSGRPMLEFIEAIPYKETREYVMAIIRNYFWYSHRLNPEQAQRLKLDFFWHGYGPQISELTAENVTQVDEVASATKPSPAPSASAAPSPSGTPSPSASPAPLQASAKASATP
jgi:hypothetical protein